MCGSNLLQGLTTASTVAGTYGQMQAARSQAAYQASIANQNAKIAESQAMAAGQAGTLEQNQIRQRARQVEGSQKAAAAASGLDISAGSPLAILGDTAYLAEQDIQTSRYNTALQQWGLTEQAKDYRSQAKYATEAGEQAAKSALLTGITSLAKQYSTFDNSGQTNKTTKKTTISPNSKYVKNTGLPNYKFGRW